jgi:serine/threonine protein kinase
MFLFIFVVAMVDPLHARYLIAHKLASGGFGEVYAGVRKKDGMPVALKVVPKKRMREINTVRFLLIENFKTKYFCF